MNTQPETSIRGRVPLRRIVRCLLVIGILVSTVRSACADSQRILLLHHATWRKEESALLEALRIYTRDLNGAIVSADATNEAAQSIGNRALSTVAEQGRKASAHAVAWFFDDGGLRLYTLRVATLDLQITPVVPRDDLEVAAQTLALKLRAFLTQDAETATRVVSQRSQAQADESVIRHDRQKSTSHEKPDDQVAALSEPSSQAAVEVDSTVSSTARPSGFVLEAAVPMRSRVTLARRVRFEVGFAYGVDVPLDPQWLRHLLVLRTAVSFTNRPLAIELDGAVATRPTSVTGSYLVEIGDYPIGLALSLRLQRPRFLLSLGPRASLHIIQATLPGTGVSGGDILRFSAGFGGSAQGRVRLFRFLSLNLAVIAEGTIPRQRFTVGGAVAADLGSFRFGSSLGLLFEVL